MGFVLSLEGGRERRAIRRATRMIARGYTHNSAAAAEAREEAQRLGLSDPRGSVRAARRAVQEAGRAGDSFELAEGHRVLAVLAAGRGDWHAAVLHGRLGIDLGTVHEADCLLLLGMGARRTAGSTGSILQPLLRAVELCDEAGDVGRQRIALMEATLYALDGNRPKAARLWLSELGRILRGEAIWTARVQCLGAWARRMERAGSGGAALDDAAVKAALETCDPPTIALAVWIRTMGAADGGQAGLAVECGRLARVWASRTLCSSQPPTFAAIVEEAALHGLAGQVDRGVVALLTRLQGHLPAAAGR